MATAVFAAGELTQSADRINYFSTSLSHTVTISNSGNASVEANTTLASGWTWSSGTGCSNAGSVINCTLAASGSASYTITDPGAADAEYDTTVYALATNNSYTGNNVTFLKIQDKELFHTLVEYGRGRGNYFFDSQFGGSGSGHTGVSCNYVPNSTLFELSYLHKVLNVQQYFGDLEADAYNVSFSCVYPARSVVRQHLTTDIVTNTTGVYTDYAISRVTGSWERMGYLSMDFLDTQQFVGENLTINCTNMTYSFPEAGGFMVVDEDSFTLEVRDREPLVANAISAATVGNGSQEVVILYNVTHNELYTIDDIVVEIKAPEYATFIGTRAELWGVGQDIYRIEKSQLAPGESILITLVARFNTSTASGITSLNLTQGINAEYTTCWELNAYNPTEYVQLIGPGIGSTPVNLSVSTEILTFTELINDIYNLTLIINNTVSDINVTVTNIESIVQVINQTTNNTLIIVQQLNITSTQLLNASTILLNNTVQILADTSNISEQLDCDGFNDSPICGKIAVLNQTIQDLLNLTLDLNNTANNLNITVIQNINLSGVNISFVLDLSNITIQLTDVKSLINCTAANMSNDTLCNRLDRIENNTIIMNNTVNNMLNLTTYFNNTIFGNLTFQDVLDAMNNVTTDTSEVVDALQEMREFDEELVFLVTDAFGQQQQARVDFLQGDVESASTKLNDANAQLVRAASMLAEQRSVLESQTPFGSSSDNAWGWIALVLIGACVSAVFMYTWRRHE
jgi:hypothetical protein